MKNNLELDKNNGVTKSNVKRSNIFNEFFWICSGANRHILRQCPTEYSKYFGIGGTIFFTAAMAMLSGGYAFYTIFNSINLAIIFGVFWGLLIFNLDRFIVNTMYSDGKHTISWGEFIAGLPRLVIALFLGVVISTPLELKIFEDEINVEIDRLIEQKLENYIAKDSVVLNELKQEKLLLYARMDSLSVTTPAQNFYENLLTNESNQRELLTQKKQNALNEQNKLNNEIHNLRRRRNNTTDSITLVQINRSIRSKTKRVNTLSTTIANIDDQINVSFSEANDIIIKGINQKDDEIKNLQEAIAKVDEKISIVESRIDSAAVVYKAKLDKEFRGFQAHMLAFEEIKKNETTKLVSLFIMFMFIIIEIAPTLFKMMIASGPYDELLREEMERKKALSITNVSIINDNANTQIQISVERNKAKLEAELLANKSVLSKIAETQVELIETAVEEWRKEELEKIKANPSEYVKSNTNS